MDMYYLSCKKKLLNDDSFIMLLGEISKKENKLRPISHEEKTHLGKICVTMIDFMVRFYKKMSWVVLYVKNAPSQAVKPVNPI